MRPQTLPRVLRVGRRTCTTTLIKHGDHQQPRTTLYLYVAPHRRRLQRPQGSNCYAEFPGQDTTAHADHTALSPNTIASVQSGDLEATDNDYDDDDFIRLFNDDVHLAEQEFIVPLCMPGW
jgi:hypothetical protein